jgi:phage N-6-adenine-methyltransferase
MVNDEWQTPPELFNAISGFVGPFDLDPCCTRDNSLCDIGAFVDEGIDGLEETWALKSTGVTRVFMNPPYSRGNIDKWVKKAAEEASTGKVVVAGLIKLDPSTKWWQDHVQQAAVILFCDRRVRFIDPDTGKPGGSPTFPSCIAIWNAHLSETYPGRPGEPVCKMWGWSS